MSHAQRLRSATDALCAAELRVTSLAKDVEAAQREELEARNAYDASGTEKDRAKYTAATQRRERAERLAHAAGQELADATAEVRAAENAGKKRLLDARIEEVSRWPSAIANDVAELVATEARAAKIVGRITTTLAGLDGAYREARAIAVDLGIEGTFRRQCLRPSTKKARLLTNIAVARSRNAAGRANGAEWIEGIEAPRWDDEDADTYRKALALLAQGKETP